MKETLVLPVHLGQTVYVHGYSFIVAEIWTAIPHGSVVPAAYFRGFLTADPHNDRIRNTCYNGGVYGLGPVESWTHACTVPVPDARDRARRLLCNAVERGFEWVIRYNGNYEFFRHENDQQERVLEIVRADRSSPVNGKLRVGNCENLCWFI